MAIGRGVGVWTANEDTEFSNFSPAMQFPLIGGGTGSFQQMVDRIREKALKDALDKKNALAKAKAETEANTKAEDIISVENIVVEETADAQDPLTLVASKKPPYLLYGGIGLVVIIGAILIFRKK